eukprot:GHVU01059139.1.p1 GENE.GHVU01059139.1~~GHVU01059139.1.p1  ORF type:complete len:211 (-),score=11.26 GHVU01059139.1:248-880(-)
MGKAASEAKLHKQAICDAATAAWHPVALQPSHTAAHPQAFLDLLHIKVWGRRTGKRMSGGSKRGGMGGCVVGGSASQPAVAATLGIQRNSVKPVISNSPGRHENGALPHRFSFFWRTYGLSLHSCAISSDKNMFLEKRKRTTGRFEKVSRRSWRGAVRVGGNFPLGSLSLSRKIYLTSPSRRSFGSRRSVERCRLKQWEADTTDGKILLK